MRFSCCILTHEKVGHGTSSLKVDNRCVPSNSPEIEHVLTILRTSITVFRNFTIH